MNIALQVFTGPEELATFFHLHDLFEKDLNELHEDPYYKGEVPNTPKCLSCFFDDKNGKVISPTEHESSKKYAKKLHLNIHPQKNHAHSLAIHPDCFHGLSLLKEKQRF